MAFQLLANSDSWKRARRGYLQAARECRAALTDLNGHWQYSPTDRRVKEAVGKWIERARNAHAFALGRKPVIEGMVVIDYSGMHEGGLFVPQPVYAPHNPATLISLGKDA